MTKTFKQPKPVSYYTLLVKSEGKWFIHFGDYDKNVVKEERADVLDSDDKAVTQIVVTDDRQASIEAHVARLNSQGF
jgi:hypothetical protein